MTGGPRWEWAAQGRCVGWTAFVLLAAVGAPLGWARFGNKAAGATHVAEPTLAGDEPRRVEGRLKSLLVGPLLGGLMGLIVSGIAGGYLIALYFFAVLSPWGPGGWWPVLPATFHMQAGGVGTKDPVILIPWLIVVGTFAAVGVVMGLVCNVSVGHRRFAVFGPRRNQTR